MQRLLFLPLSSWERGYGKRHTCNHIRDHYRCQWQDTERTNGFCILYFCSACQSCTHWVEFQPWEQKEMRPHLKELADISQFYISFIPTRVCPMKWEPTTRALNRCRHTSKNLLKSVCQHHRWLLWHYAWPHQSDGRSCKGTQARKLKVKRTVVGPFRPGSFGSERRFEFINIGSAPM